MGATGWAYFAKYKKDLGAVLEGLREETFRAKKFYSVDPKAKPATIEELQEMNAEEGTHSILDIGAIADTASFGVAAPLPKDELVALLGTDKPDHKLVAAKAHDLQTVRTRWEGTYVIVYKDGKPDEVFFTGFSGD